MLHSQASFAPGDVFIGARDRNYMPEPDSSELEQEMAGRADGNSLLQISACKRQRGRRKVPVPAGQTATHARTVLCLIDTCVPDVVPQSGFPLRLGANADMLPAAFGDFDLRNLRQSFEGMDLPRLCKALCKAYRAPPRTPLKLFRFTLMGLITQPLPRQRRRQDGHFASQACSAGPGRGSILCRPCSNRRGRGYPANESSLFFRARISGSSLCPCLCFPQSSAYLAGIRQRGRCSGGFRRGDPDRAQHALTCRHCCFSYASPAAKLHIDSHSGHVLNDLADCVAKHVATSPQDSQVPENFDLASQQGVLPWLGFAANMCKDLPRIGEEGIAGPLHVSHKTAIWPVAMTFRSSCRLDRR